MKFRENLSPKNSADAINKTECENCYIPLEPGEYVLVYPEREPALSSSRVAVINSSGIFGSTRGFAEGGYDFLVNESNLALMQGMLADRSREIARWALVTRDFSIGDRITFTRGELVPLKTGGNGTVEALIFKDFTKQTAKFNEVRALPPDSAIVKVGENAVAVQLRPETAAPPYLQDIDFDRLAELQARRQTGGWGRTDISRRWPRLYKGIDPIFKVRCDEKKTLSGSAESAVDLNAKVSIAADLKGIVSFFEAGASASAEFDQKFKESIAVEQIFENQALDLRTFAYLSPIEENRIGQIGNWSLCEGKERTGPRSYRALVPGLANWAVDRDLYNKIEERFGKGPEIVWRQQSGKLAIRCHQAGYRPLKDYFRTELAIPTPMIDAIFSQMIEINRPDPARAVSEFFSC